MKRFLSSLLVASMLATSVPAWADEPAPSPAPVVTPLNKGQMAPYTGVLMSPEAVAQVIAEREGAAATLILAVQRQADLDTAKLKFEVGRLTTTCTADKTVLHAQIDDGKRQINILNEELKKESSGLSGFQLVGIGAGAGLVIGILGVVLVGAAAN
jgi:hypothetical protein